MESLLIPSYTIQIGPKFGSWWGDTRMFSTVDNIYRIWGKKKEAYLQVHFSNMFGLWGAFTFKSENISKEDLKKLLKGEVPT